MRKMIRVALVTGMMMMSVGSVEAREVHAPDDVMATPVLVMNN